MLPKRHRLDRTRFKKAFSAGRISHTPHFTVRVSSGDMPYVACVISKKIAPLAVDRNKIKRRVMMAASSIIKKGQAKNHSIIFFAKKGVGKITFSELESEVKKILV